MCAHGVCRRPAMETAPQKADRDTGRFWRGARGARAGIVCVQGGRGRPGRASKAPQSYSPAAGRAACQAKFFVELVCGAALGAHPLSPRMMTLSKTFLRAAMPGAS